MNDGEIVKEEKRKERRYRREKEKKTKKEREKKKCCFIGACDYWKNSRLALFTNILF